MTLTDQLIISESINLSMIQKVEEGQLELLLTYEDDNNTLIGFLGIFSFVDKKKVEIAGMVHPSYRNKGKFMLLLGKAWQICNLRNTEEILLVCPTKSQEAKRLIGKLQARYSFSEFTMQYYNVGKQEGENMLLEIQKAKEEDIEAIVQLFRDGFDFDKSKDSITPLLERNRTQEGFELYVIKEQNKPIATLTITDEESSIYISAFTVTPAQRGKGIGREILRSMITLIEKRYPNKLIRLDVDVKNNNALKLYEGVGFQKLSGYDYYLLGDKK